MNRRILMQHLRALSYRYPVEGPRDWSYIQVRRFRTPPGYSPSTIQIRLRLPEDYPASPPGVSPSRVYVPANLKYQGQTPEDFHPDIGPAGWAWWCFEHIAWDPCRDDLITFFEVLRLTMTHPRVKGEDSSWVRKLLFG